MEVAGDLFSLLRDLRTDCSNHTAAERAKLRALSLELPDLLVPLQKYHVVKKRAAALLAGAWGATGRSRSTAYA